MPYSFAAVDENGESIAGYEAIPGFEFDDVLVLNDAEAAPVAIDGYTYLNAAINDAQIAQIVKETIEETVSENGLKEIETESTINRTVYYYMNGDERVDLNDGDIVVLHYSKDESDEAATEEDAAEETAGYTYSFVGIDDVVWLSDLLNQVQPELTENNYTFSVSDDSLVKVEEGKQNISYNGSNIGRDQSLTALGYFDAVVLTLTSKNGKQAVEITLKNPAPVVEPTEIPAEAVSVGTLSEEDTALYAEEIGLTADESEKIVTDEEGNEKTVYTKSGFFGLDIAVNAENLTEGSTYRVPVALDPLIDMIGKEHAVVENVSFVLYHIVDGEGVPVEELPVRKNGKTIAYTVEEAAVPEGYSAAVTGDAATGFTITNTHEAKPTGEITILKVGSNDIAKALEGAYLQITDPDDKKIKTWKTEGEAKTITGLSFDVEYTITEIAAPDGYSVVDPITFTLKEDGTIETTATLDGKTMVIVDKVKEPTPTPTTKPSGGGSSYSGGGSYGGRGGSVAHGSSEATPAANAKTGDDNPITLYALLGLAATAVILEEIIRRRRKSKSGRE